MIYVKAPKGTPTDENTFISQFFGKDFVGYFVDVGAHDGRSYSNTRPLWERGWRGLLIEPDPSTFKQLTDYYPCKDRLEFLNAAVCDKDGPVDFYKHADPERTGWHSMDQDWIRTWEPGKSRKITVKGVRFASLKLPPVIDFLSVDTEGYDATLLQGMPESIRPRLIMCEVDKNGVRHRIEGEMARRRYEFVWGTYLNSAYAAS